MTRVVSVERFAYVPGVCTLGRITVGDDSWYSLECPWRNNLPYKSCIPEGTYIVNQYSSHKYPYTYEIQNVARRSQCLFHSANWVVSPDGHTLLQGCISLGKDLMKNSWGVSRSRDAVSEFLAALGDVYSFELRITSFKPEYV